MTEYGVRLRGGLIAPAASAAYALGYGQRPVVAREPGSDWRLLTPAQVRAVRAAEIPMCDRPGHSAIDRHRTHGQAFCVRCCDWWRYYERRRTPAAPRPQQSFAGDGWDWARINTAITGIAS